MRPTSLPATLTHLTLNTRGLAFGVLFAGAMLSMGHPGSAADPPNLAANIRITQRGSDAKGVVTHEAWTGPDHAVAAVSSLDAAVNMFNQREATGPVGKDQPRLTSDAVVAAIRWNLLPTSQLDVSDGIRAALREITVTRVLPDSFRLEALTGCEPDGTTVFTMWSVRLRIPVGGPDAYGTTTCISIHESMVNSRVMGPAEQAIVEEWRRQTQDGSFAFFEHQLFIEERQKAIEADRKK